MKSASAALMLRLSSSQVPYCTPPAVRYFNIGECSDECPEYQDQVRLNGEEVCLPMISREADRLEETTLEAINEGVSDIALRFSYPLLPLQFAENVSTSFVVDMKPSSSELDRLNPRECDAKWTRQFANSSAWTLSGTPFTMNIVRDHPFQALGDIVSGLRVYAPEKFTWDIPGLQPREMARVFVTLIFEGSEDGTNSQDSISLKVNEAKQEPYWPSLGQDREDREDGGEMYRHHVCMRGTASTSPAAHCKHHFYFDAESDDDGNLKIELEGKKSAESAEHFTWTFADFKVELPYIQGTFTFNDFNGACQLNPSVTRGGHIERTGVVGLGLVGTWEGSDGTTRRQLLKNAEWPFRALWSSLVTSSYLPFSAWQTFVGPEVVAEGQAFTGELEVFESGQFIEDKRVPRFQVGDIAYARQCLDDRNLPFNLEWRSLYMSDTEDPASEAVFRSQYNLTDAVTVLDSDRIPGSEGTCVYLSFVIQQPCEWCFLHSYAIAQPAQRRLKGRKLSQIDDQDCELSQDQVLECDEVQSQPQDVPGIAINTADHRINFLPAEVDEVGGTCATAGSLLVPLAVAMTGFVV